MQKSVPLMDEKRFNASHSTNEWSQLEARKAKVVGAKAALVGVALLQGTQLTSSKPSGREKRHSLKKATGTWYLCRLRRDSA